MKTIQRLVMVFEVLILLVGLTVIPLPVSAAPVVIDFEDLPASGAHLAPTVFVNDQYRDKGITFNSPHAWDYSLGVFAMPDFARSGTKAIETCFSEEFCTVPIRMSFTAPQPRVKVWVGYDGLLHRGMEQSRTVVLRALDAGGQEVGRATADFLIGQGRSTLIRTPLEVTSANANITHAEVQLLHPDGSIAITNGLAVDDVEFEAGPPVPCPSTQNPSVTLTRPDDGQTVQVNAFLLQANITTDAPLSDAKLTITGSGRSRTVSLFKNVSPTGDIEASIIDALFPGSNTLTVEARNCLGVGQSNSRTITFAPMASGTRFKLLGLEVTQVIQDLVHTVPLIAGKRTFVRVYLSVEGPTSLIQNVSGYLSACRPRPGTPFCGEFLPIDPTSTETRLKSTIPLNVTSSTNITAMRQNFNASLNFELPANWRTAGLLHLHISRLEIGLSPSPLPCDGCDNLIPEGYPRVYQFENAPPVRLRLVSVPYTVTSPGGTPTTFNPRQIDINLLTSWLQRAYPSSTFNILPNTTTAARRGVINPNGNITSFNCKDVNKDLASMFIVDTWRGVDARTRYYGLVFDGRGVGGGFMRGCSIQFEPGVPSPAASGPAGPPAVFLPPPVWDTDQSYGDWYGGHEIGHSYGRRHVLGTDGCGGVPANDKFIDNNYPFPAGFIGDPTLMDFFGFDVGDPTLTIGRQVYAPNIWTDVMSYRCNQWISSYTYTGILNRLRREEGSSGSSAQSMASPEDTADLESVLSDGLMVQGEINLTRGTITLDPFLRLPGLEATPRPANSLYTIALFDEDGNRLALFPFEPKELTDNPPDEDQIALLNEVIPYSPGTVSIAILKENLILAEKAVSPNVPEVMVISPNGGETLQDETVVTWQASDPDGDQLTYTLLYSANAGQTWQTIDVGIEKLDHQVNLQELPGSEEALFRVIATDGVNTSMDESDAVFRVPPKTPQVRIISPVDGSVFLTADTVVFEGEASDLEEGNLDGEAVQWSSDLQGVLGIGRSIAVAGLMPGRHVITLRAQDNSGAEGTASIQIELTGIPPELVYEPPVQFVVNTLTDMEDVNPGDGTCADVNSNCSLRAAIQETNALPGHDAVILPAGNYTLTIGGENEDLAATGDLDINDSLTLTGHGASGTTIDGGGLDRIFEVSPGLTVELSGVTIRNGSAPEGGGISIKGSADDPASQLTITDSVISGNQAATDGGGISSNSHSNINIIRSTISGNTAGGSGGGIRHGREFNVGDGTLYIENSTISGNTAGSSGGGIDGLNGSLIDLLNSTITANSAQFGGSISTFAGSSSRARNTIFANSLSGGECSPALALSLGNNLDTDGSCILTEPTDLSNTDPMLGPLADNGGPAPTHALLPGSPAIDAGDSSLCPAVDQRGLPRPQGARCDIGSYEAEAEVVDAIPTTIKPAANPSVLWPPNGEIVPVVVSGQGRFSWPLSFSARLPAEY